MTAEIVIINQQGVAMAADSAVTFGSQGTQKIMNSAIKLFSLSRSEPVGVMIYGNADLLNIPWETFIKLYRKVHNSPLEKLEQYGVSFIEFLKSKVMLFSEEQQDNWAKNRISVLYNEILEAVSNALTALSSKGIQITESIIHQHYESLILEYVMILRGYNFVYPKEISPELESKIIKITEEQINQTFLTVINSPDTNQQTKDALYELGRLAILNCTSVQASGIVISGFGNEDIFPSVITYEIYGFFNGQLLYKVLEDKTCINENATEMTSVIIPFAQEDVVRSFLDGIHPELFQYAISYTEKSIETMLNSSLVNLSPSIMPSQIANAFASDLMVEMQNFMSRKLLSPMINMIQALPKDELASMAEALVNMTAFRRKMAYGSLETVGGPIDVAVISKGDGLVWVKRKHYFPAELNTHFFENYFK